MSNDDFGNLGSPVQPRTFMPSINAMIPKVDPPGKWMRERLIKSIVQFESKLAPNQEIAGRIVNCPGPEGSFHILDVGCWGDMIIFHGETLDGLPMELLQHHSQVSVLLIALAVEDGTAKRIGFELSSKLQASSK